MMEVSEIVSGIVDQINTTIIGTFDSVTGKTFVCSTKWARVGMQVTDEAGEVFLITGMEPDEWIIGQPIIPAIPPATKQLEGVIFLADPFFITGTQLAANREWTLANTNLTNKLPLIWLLEVVSEVAYGRGDTRERDMELRLFFLDETDPSQYYTADHRREVVKPMQALMYAFIDAVENDPIFATLLNWRYRTFSRFGVESETGMLRNILDANLSGIALEITISKYKENCNC